MKRGRCPDLNGWGNYAELERRLQERGIVKPIRQSFVRLVKDSKYFPNAGIYSFTSCHAYYTEPRLRRISKHIGILWVRENDEVCYNNRYFWTVTESSGRDLLEKIRKLRVCQEIDFSRLI